MRSRWLVFMACLLTAMSAARAQVATSSDTLLAADVAAAASASAAVDRAAPAQIAEPVFFRADGESRLTPVDATVPPVPAVTVRAVRPDVPEPHTWLLILSGLAVGAFLVRRARSG
jgi:hypothetical protein